MMLDLVWLWGFFAAILKCDIKMNSGLNDNNGIQFVDQENIIIVGIPPHVPKWNYFRFSGAIWNVGVKVGMGTVLKHTLENMV